MQKVDMMLGSSEFAPYRQAALSVEAVKRRVEMVQKELSAAVQEGGAASAGAGKSVKRVQTRSARRSRRRRTAWKSTRPLRAVVAATSRGPGRTAWC